MSKYQFQIDAVNAAETAVREGRNLAIVSPTGSGKSYMQASLMKRLGPTHYQTVPNMDIGLGVLRKLDPLAVGDALARSEDWIQSTLERNRIFTIKRLYNLLMSGSIALPKSITHDEGHHSVDNTHVVVDQLCACPSVMFTATYFRGTPDETAKLKARWGEPYVALKLKDAVATGVISRPKMLCWPLVNDDMIEVRKGEFVVKQLESAIVGVMDELIERLRAFYSTASGRWIQPITVVCPSVAICLTICEAMNRAGLPALSITGETTKREAAFDTVVAGNAALCQVRVVGEGVDLPLRIMVDLAPSLSPVLWMQRIGRITRPGDVEPLYIATNHNLTRHAYLWAGVIPPSYVRDAQLAWGPDYKPTRRSLCRALGLDGFGKFKVTTVPAVDGSLVSLYTLQTQDGMHQYAVLLHPCVAEPTFFEKTNVASSEKATFIKQMASGPLSIEYTKKLYGPWKKIDTIPSLDGYVTTKPGPMTEKQHAWWKRSAKSRGFDPEYTPDAREFQVLPIMVDTRQKFKLEE